MILTSEHMSASDMWHHGQQVACPQGVLLCRLRSWQYRGFVVAFLVQRFKLGTEVDHLLLAFALMHARCFHNPPQAMAL